MWQGYALASFAVLPVAYDGSTAVLHPDITLRVRLTFDPRPDQNAPQRVTARGAADIKTTLTGNVINPAALSSYSPLPVAPPPGGGFAPTPVPSLEGSPVEYLIITPDSLAAAWQRFADWKTAKGVPAVVRSIESIEAAGRRGSDVQETIRFYIRDAWQKWGTRYVLLGGDTRQVPARFAYTTYYYGGTSIPTDMYYACLDGSWNADNDNLWGEMPSDAPDLYAEVYTGRLTTESVAEVNQMIDKIESYEIPTYTSSVDRALFLSEVLFPTPWNPGDPIQDDGASHSEFVYAKNMTTAALRVDRLYENYTSYPGSYLESRQSAIDSINTGYGFVLHYGHGYRFNMHVADDNILVPDADAFTNTNRYSNLFMVNCTAAAFDFDCLAEHMLSNPSGGMVSVIGSANSAFVNVSTHYTDEYTRLMFSANEVHLGESFHNSRLPRTPLALIGDNIDLWTHYIYTLLADPEMAMFTGPARPLTVLHPDTISTGTTSFLVTVMRDGSPADSAVVCAWKPGDDYRVFPTDASGTVVIPFRADTPGSIGIVVTARNSMRTESSIAVANRSGALLSFTGTVIDDGGAAGTYGGQDGVIDAGETVDALASITNTGTATSLPATITLSTTNAWVTVTNAAATLGSLASGMTTPADTPWRLVIAPDTPDGTVADFTVTAITAADTMTDTFARVIHAPAPTITLTRTDDSIGDGNGVVSAGEPFLLYLNVKNYGSGAVTGLNAIIVPIGSGIAVSGSTAIWPTVPAMSEAENSVGFSLSESSVMVENPFAVTFADMAGHVWRDTLELRAPTPPSGILFDPSLGIDRLGLSWTTSASPDVAGYLVYRSFTSGGPYARVSPDVVAHALFVDEGLQPSTRYYYVVTAVDSAHNESVASAESGGSTNAPQAAGWPNILPSASSSSPAVGDVDGDGKLDVIIGSDQLYAWHADGTELRDGDGKPLTWGVFNTIDSDFVAPPTLASLDYKPRMDIIAPAYTSKEMYVFDGNGQTRPGWPQPTYDNVRAAVAVGNVDDDWQKELVAIDQSGWLYVWNDDGTELVDGDADTSTVGVFKRFPDTPWWQVQSPALADIDNDGRDEILVATQDSMLYVLNNDGSEVPGWPRALSGFAGGGLAVGDIDGDGSLEIVVPSRSSEILALRSNNTVLWQRFVPQNLFFNPSPALADIDNDGKLETILPSSSGWLYVFEENGADAPGWPVQYGTSGTESSPIVADLDGDGMLDIALGNEQKHINAWNATGQQLDGFPLVIGDAVRGTPTACDVDGDGDVEITVAGFDRNVYMWDLTAAYNANLAPWPRLHANLSHTGEYPLTVASGAAQTPSLPRSSALRQNYPNPFNPATSIEFDVGPGASRRVVLSVYDIHGARVRTLVDGTLRPGSYRRVWDGKNNHGQRVGSGVYFYRLRAGRTTVATRKMVILK